MSRSYVKYSYVKCEIVCLVLARQFYTNHSISVLSWVAGVTKI